MTTLRPVSLLLALALWAGCGQAPRVTQTTQAPAPVAPACEPSAEVCDLADNDCDGQVDEGTTNACGGCGVLEQAPLEVCGACGAGTTVCATPDATICVNDTPTNACGGCQPLPYNRGSACGVCGGASWVCDGQEAVRCEGQDARNACGGCASLDAAPGEACGVCGSGQVVCVSPEAAQCQGDQGEAARNACGLCGPLPELGCGVCGDEVVGEGEQCDDGGRDDGDGCSAACQFEVAWVTVEPGRFIMGSPQSERGRRDSEIQHLVELTRRFELRATELTRAEWEGVMGTRPWSLAGCGPSCAASKISWWDALVFLNRLSERDGLEACYRLDGCEGEPGTGCEGGAEVCEFDFTCANATFVGLDCAGYRLPTEAEWEYAARAGSETAFPTGDLIHTARSPLDPNLDLIGWYSGNSAASYEGAQDCAGWFTGATTCGPQEVATKRPNAWGLFDMHGGVYEWVWDWDAPLPISLQIDPLGPTGGEARVRRGGAWNSPSQFCRSAFRFGNEPSMRREGVGLRVARTLGE
jgi:cysteine-rich repeat protein